MSFTLENANFDGCIGLSEECKGMKLVFAGHCLLWGVGNSRQSSVWLCRDCQLLKLEISRKCALRCVTSRLQSFITYYVEKIRKVSQDSLKRIPCFSLKMDEHGGTHLIYGKIDK